MAVTELDHSAIESRIVAILQANATLYTTSGEANKLRLITKGHPFSHSWKDKVFPYCFVSFKNQRTTLFGSKTTAEIQGAKHIVAYDIVFAVNQETGRDAETALNDFQKLIIEELEENTQLVNPSGGTDPKCVDSVVQANGAITETIGFDIQARSLSLICQFRVGTDTSKIVNSGDVILTNTTNSKVFKLLFNVKVFISMEVTKFQLTNSNWDKFYDLPDYAIEADMLLAENELPLWTAYVLQTNNVPGDKVFTLAFPDKDANTTTLTGTFKVVSITPSATDDRDANIHIRLESSDLDGNIGTS